MSLLDTPLMRLMCMQYCAPDVFERQQAQATALQRAAKLRAVDNILWNRKPPWPFIEQVGAPNIVNDRAPAITSAHKASSSCSGLRTYKGMMLEFSHSAYRLY